jgi:hypothetical protein
MNEAAQITSVKHRAERKEDFTTELAELQLQDAGYQMWCALRNALCSIPWSGLSREEKLAAAAATGDSADQQNERHLRAGLKNLRCCPLRDNEGPGHPSPSSL